MIEVRGGEGRLYNDFTGRVKPEDAGPPRGEERVFVLALDAAQYQLDANRMAESDGEDVYAGMNILLRRKPKENNFKAILECIRDLTNADVVVPEWLHDIFLGYGDPAAAQPANMPNQLRTVDFKDTFLDAQHLSESFRDARGGVLVDERGRDAASAFRVTFPEPPSDGDAAAGPLVVESYVPPDPGPYPENQPNLNRVRFTPVQVEAIRDGVQPGLTMVVGPPGTGKTDTATQILHCLYHNEPGQRTLLITHSNAALNDLFQKLMERDVPARGTSSASVRARRISTPTWIFLARDASTRCSRDASNCSRTSSAWPSVWAFPRMWRTRVRRPGTSGCCTCCRAGRSFRRRRRSPPTRISWRPSFRF